MQPIGFQQFKEWLMGHNQNNQRQISDICPRLVFTTSGLPSTPLPLTPVGKTHCGRRLTLTERVSQYNGLYSIYKGDLDGERVVTKITEDHALGEVLQHEASVYNHLSDLQGLVIPNFLGLFRAGSGFLLITADCGMPLSSFSSLSKAERYVFFLFHYHF
jgi:hypothetical protein